MANASPFAIIDAIDKLLKVFSASFFFIKFAITFHLFEQFPPADRVHHDTQLRFGAEDLAEIEDIAIIQCLYSGSLSAHTHCHFVGH